MCFAFFFLLHAIALLSECDMLLQKHLCFRQHDVLSKAYGILALGQIYVKLFLEKIYFFHIFRNAKTEQEFSST